MNDERRMNAVIKSVWLGIEDHGIPTYVVQVNHERGSQGFGTYDLRYYGINLILELLKTVGADSWEGLVGKSVRVEQQNGILKGIGHFIEDRWFYPEKMDKAKP